MLIKIWKLNINLLWFMPFGKDSVEKDWYFLPTLLTTTSGFKEKPHPYDSPSRIRAILFTLCWFRMGLVTLALTWEHNDSK